MSAVKSKQSTKKVSQEFPPVTQINVMIKAADDTTDTDTNGFHWVPESQELLREFQAKVILEFGNRKTSRVIDTLVRKYVQGRIRVTL